MERGFLSFLGQRIFFFKFATLSVSCRGSFSAFWRGKTEACKAGLRCVFNAQELCESTMSRFVGEDHKAPYMVVSHRLVLVAQHHTHLLCLLPGLKKERGLMKERFGGRGKMDAAPPLAGGGHFSWLLGWGGMGWPCWLWLQFSSAGAGLWCT